MHRLARQQIRQRGSTLSGLYQARRPTDIVEREVASFQSQLEAEKRAMIRLKNDKRRQTIIVPK